LFTSHGGTRIMIDAITAITADEIAQGRKGDGWRDGADARRVGRADAGGTGGAEAGLRPGTPSRTSRACGRRWPIAGLSRARDAAE
jgi:hypothetical protein